MIDAETGGRPEDRRLEVGPAGYVAVGSNRSLLHAVRLLDRLGATISGAPSLAAARSRPDAPLAILVAGDMLAGQPDPVEGDPTEIYLWDYEVGRPGLGDFACAVSGVSTVIGAADGPPGLMPAHIPEKWAGTFGASLALALSFARQHGESPSPRRIDVSAADALRAFAEQNSGNHAGVPYGWRRNGRTAVEHGGVFPQGFFRCRDGFLAVQARSRQDWHAIIEALDAPAWSQEPKFQNPFKLSEDDSEILPLLETELMKRDRRDLLDRALDTGAPMAPVLSQAEAAVWDVFRGGFVDPAGGLRMPFTVTRRT